MSGRDRRRTGRGLDLSFGSLTEDGVSDLGETRVGGLEGTQ